MHPKEDPLPQPEPEPDPEPIIVAAVGSSAAARDPLRAQRLETAMTAAIRDALAAGVSPYDADEIGARLRAARESVKAGN